MSALTADLVETAERARDAAMEFGLDFPEVVFELVDPDELNMVASYGGFPVRYSHWRFGMEFEHLPKSHVYGLSKIYELVINNDPGYAYLLEDNTPIDQKLVIAHVFGHADFFPEHTGSDDQPPHDGRMANHATRVRRHIERLGIEKVESFIDSCLCIENLIDPMSPFITRRAPERTEKERQKQAEESAGDPAYPRQVVHGQVHQPAGLPGSAAAEDRA